MLVPRVASRGQYSGQHRLFRSSEVGLQNFPKLPFKTMLSVRD